MWALHRNQPNIKQWNLSTFIWKLPDYMFLQKLSSMSTKSGRMSGPVPLGDLEPPGSLGLPPALPPAVALTTPGVNDTRSKRVPELMKSKRQREIEGKVHFTPFWRLGRAQKKRFWIISLSESHAVNKKTLIFKFHVLRLTSLHPKDYTRNKKISLKTIKDWNLPTSSSEIRQTSKHVPAGDIKHVKATKVPTPSLSFLPHRSLRCLWELWDLRDLRCLWCLQQWRSQRQQESMKRETKGAWIDEEQKTDHERWREKSTSIHFHGSMDWDGSGATIGKDRRNDPALFSLQSCLSHMSLHLI